MSRFSGLLALVLITACVIEPDDRPPEVKEVLSRLEPFPRWGGKQEADRCYSLTIGGAWIGTERYTRSRYVTPRGERWVIRERMREVDDREFLDLEYQSEYIAMLGEKGKLLRFWERSRQLGSEEKCIQGGKVDSDMVSVWGPQVRRIPFEPDIHDNEFLLRFHLADEVTAESQAVRYRRYLTPIAGYADTESVVKKVEGNGEATFEIETTSEARPGLTRTIRSDSCFRVIEETAFLNNRHFRKQLVECGQELARPAKAPVESQSQPVSSDVSIENPRALVRARYRIEGIPDAAENSWFGGPGQRVVGNVSGGQVVLEVVRLGEPPLHSFPPRATDAALLPHLAATAMVQADNPRIRLQASLITFGSATAWEAAKRLHHWVSREILSSDELGFASALEVFKRQRGDCSEKSLLLAAMARSVGIPARCVGGLIAAGETFAKHMWTEVWVGRWQPMDPAWIEERVSAGWIRLGVDSVGLTDELLQNNKQLFTSASIRKVLVEELETE